MKQFFAICLIALNAFSLSAYAQYCRCGANRKYDANELDLTKIKQLLYQDPHDELTIPNNKPTAFDNIENLIFNKAECAKPPFSKYRLSRDSASINKGTDYDRAVFKGERTFCGCITHENLPDNKFRLCEEIHA